MEIDFPASPPAFQAASVEKRAAPRQQVRQRVTLRISNEKTLLGLTMDISPHGAFVQVQSPMWGVVEGSGATLQMMAEEDLIQWPCQVVRMNRDGVGLRRLDGKAPSFSDTFQPASTV